MTETEWIGRLRKLKSARFRLYKELEETHAGINECHVNLAGIRIRQFRIGGKIKIDEFTPSSIKREMEIRIKQGRGAKVE